MSYAGKVAVITGASRGLGAGVAQAFLDAGLQVGVCARNQPEFAGASVVSEAVDVTDAEALEAFGEKVATQLGPIDLWINNAAILTPIVFARELSPADLARHLEINLTGCLLGAQVFLRHRAERATLINVSSGAALKGYPGWTAYCASKAALDRLSECLALEEEGTGLRVLSVAPGVIDTDMQATIRATPKEKFPLLDKFLQLKEDDAFNTPGFIANHYLELAFGEAEPESVVVRLPAEKG